MELLTASMLQALNTERKKQFEGLLPQIVKKLIIAGISDLTSLRIPSGNDIWARGFDGVISCATGNTYVAEGTSVWEFGTSEDALTKLDSDYSKRTTNPLGLDKTKTTFYLVIPKIWAYNKPRTKWEAERTDWKSVHVYDASVLCDWINSEPTVVSWLLEVLFEKSVDFSGIDQAWDLFSKKTNPAFTADMFLDNREREIDILNKSLNQPIIKVKSESFIDSVGFVLGALAQNQEFREKCIVVYNAATYKTISTLVNNKTIILNYTCSHDIVPSGNSIIVNYNKEAISIKPDIQLSPYSKLHYYNAFRKMGLSDSEAHELYAFCHGNLRALIRRIPGTANEHMPDWAGVEEKKLLEPIVYLRTINTDFDRELVEKITNTTFDIVEEFYKALLQKEDSPIKRIENNYLIINYEEAWSVLGCSVNDNSFDRFHLSVKWLFEILRTEGVYSGRFGQAQMIQQHVRNLLLNYVYYSFSAENSYKLSEAVADLLHFTFDDCMSNLLIDNLAVLAEAAPLTVLEFIEKDLNDEDSSFLPLFSAGDYQHGYTGVLSALDELTLYRQSSIKTCKLLFSLYQKDYEYKILNSPIESLLTALCLFNSEVALTIQQKRDLVSYFYKIDAYHTCELICMLLGKDSFWKSVRYGKHHNDAKNELTIQEIIDTSEFIANVAFEYCASTGDVSILQKLLKQYHYIRPQFLEDQARKLSLGSFYNEDLIPTVFQLKNRVYSIQKYQLEDEQPYLPALKLWSDLLLSACSETEQDDWLFYKTDECPSELLLTYKDDYSLTKEQEQIIRIEKLRNVLEKEGGAGIIRLSKRMENNSYWGSLLSEFINDVSLNELIEVLISDGKIAIIGGIIDNVSIDIARAIYSITHGDLRTRILANITREDFWKLLETEEEKKEYWKYRDMFSFNKENYEQFLIYNPRGLLFFFYDKMEKEPLAYIEQAKRTIRLIADSEQDFNYRVNRDEYYIAEIVKKIDSMFYSDEWAATTIQLYSKGFVQKMPLSGKIFFFHNPIIFVDYVSKDPHRRHIEEWKFSLPENACDEYDVLVFFVETLINSDNKRLAGIIVGKIPGGEDGVRLSEKTRELLEHVDDKGFDNEVISGIIQTIGIRNITDGTDLKVLSYKYEKDASELELFYPHAAYILRNLSRFYMSEGKRDYVDSELFD